MKKLIKLIKTTKETIEVEVEFPIYREHDVGGDNYDAVIYTRIDPEKQVSVNKVTRYGAGSEIEWEIEVKRARLDGQPMDYVLGGESRRSYLFPGVPTSPKPGVSTSPKQGGNGTSPKPLPGISPNRLPGMSPNGGIGTSPKNVVFISVAQSITEMFGSQGLLR